MSISTPVEEIMKSEAEFGLFNCYHKIGKIKAQSLRNEGFDVTDSREVDYFPRMHRISWEDAVVNVEDVKELDENSDDFTHPQRLWIITSKSNLSCNQKN